PETCRPGPGQSRVRRRRRRTIRRSRGTRGCSTAPGRARHSIYGSLRCRQHTIAAVPGSVDADHRLPHAKGQDRGHGQWHAARKANGREDPTPHRDVGSATARFVGKRRTVLLAGLTYALVLSAAKITGSDVGGINAGVEGLSSGSGGVLGGLGALLPLGYAFGAGMVAAVNPCG